MKKNFLAAAYNPINTVYGVISALHRIPWLFMVWDWLLLVYGAPFVKILYMTDLAQKLLSLRIFSYLCAKIAISAHI